MVATSLRQRFLARMQLTSATPRLEKGGKLPQFQTLSNQQTGALTEDFQLGSNGVVRRKDFGKLGFREVQVFMEDAFEQGDNVQGRA